MTLIVGIKCTNGIVMGSDGAATLGAAGIRTALQPVSKLHIVRGAVIVGVSGPVGLGQLFVDRVDSTWNGLRDATVQDTARSLRDSLLKDAQIAFQTANLARQVLGSIAAESVLSHTLIAIAPKRLPSLIQFDYLCNPETANDDLPFVAVGSGQPIADPFLAFLRRVFWKNGLPSMSDGRFVVMWTLRHAIQTAPAGIAEPIQMATLEIDGTQPKAKELTEEEIRELRQGVKDIETYIGAYKQEQTPTGTEQRPPTPPTT